MIARPDVRRYPSRGRVRSRIEALERLVLPPAPVEVIPPHPIGDLTGMTAEEIGDALCASISEGHGDDPLWNADAETGRLCRRCKATLEIAVEAAERLVDGHGLNPLIDVFDLQLLWRDEMEGWTKLHPGATFDYAAWRADRNRMRDENLDTDHYRGEIPPWVVVPR